MAVAPYWHELGSVRRNAAAARARAPHGKSSPLGQHHKPGAEAGAERGQQGAPPLLGRSRRLQMVRHVARGLACGSRSDSAGRGTASLTAACGVLLAAGGSRLGHRRPRPALDDAADRVSRRRLVTSGRYRLLSHPNYLIVIGEPAILPLAFDALPIAFGFSACNAVVLLRRVRFERAALGWGTDLRALLSSPGSCFGYQRRTPPAHRR